MENLINSHGSLPQRSIKIPPYPPLTKGGYEMPPFVKGGWGDFYKAGNCGFTLIELLIAMAVGLIVLGAMYGVFTMHNKTFSNQEQIAEMQQNARAAMDMMTREIRMAGYDPERTGLFTFQFSASDGRKTDSNNIAFTYDDNEDGIPDNNDKEQLAFCVQDGTLKRFSTGAIHWQPVAENIDVLELTYTLSDGTVIAPPSSPTAAQVLNIAKVGIQMTAKTSKPDPDYTPNGGYRTYTLTSVITPRNLGL